MRRHARPRVALRGSGSRWIPSYNVEEQKQHSQRPGPRRAKLQLLDAGGTAQAMAVGVNLSEKQVSEPVALAIGEGDFFTFGTTSSTALALADVSGQVPGHDSVSNSALAGSPHHAGDSALAAPLVLHGRSGTEMGSHFFI